MKKYYWDINSSIFYLIALVISNIVLFLILGPKIDSNLLAVIFTSLMVLIVDSIIIVYGIAIPIKESTTFDADTITVRRRFKNKYTVSVKKIKRVYVSMQYFEELAGRDYKLTLTANDLQGAVLGINKQMLQAVLTIYPHLKMVILCPVRKLGKDNAILLAKRGYLNEKQLKEVQKRYKLSDGFEKLD